MTPPPGFRFLIQLVDAKTFEEAKAEIAAMFGKRTLEKCTIKYGTEPMSNDTYRPAVPSDTGFTVFVPENWSV